MALLNCAPSYWAVNQDLAETDKMVLYKLEPSKWYIVSMRRNKDISCKHNLLLNDKPLLTDASPSISI